MLFIKKRKEPHRQWNNQLIEYEFKKEGLNDNRPHGFPEESFSNSLKQQLNIRIKNRYKGDTIDMFTVFMQIIPVYILTYYQEYIYIYLNYTHSHNGY